MSTITNNKVYGGDRSKLNNQPPKAPIRMCHVQIFQDGKLDGEGNIPELPCRDPQEMPLIDLPQYAYACLQNHVENPPNEEEYALLQKTRPQPTADSSPMREVIMQNEVGEEVVIQFY